MSAIGSIIIIYQFIAVNYLRLKAQDFHRLIFCIIYQLAFLMPGKSALLANSLKQIRHNPKSLMKPWLRPQRQQRLTIRVENFGVLLAFTINAFLAILKLINLS
jgi:hypothetical protein